MPSISTAVTLTAAATAAALFFASPWIAGAEVSRDNGTPVAWSAEVRDDATYAVETTQDAAGDTHVEVRLSGLAPRTRYALHAHEAPCGADEVASGPHYQHVFAFQSDRFVARSNEVRVELRTDRHGRAEGRTTVGWQLPPGRTARSLLLHGQRLVVPPSAPRFWLTLAGALACLDVDLADSGRVRLVGPGAGQ